MTELSTLAISGIIEGSERLADDIARGGVTPKTFLQSAFRESIVKRMAELETIPYLEDRRFAELMRRKQTVFARLSALLTIYSNSAAEYRRAE